MKLGARQGLFQDLYHRPYTNMTRIKLYNSSKGSLDLIQRLRLIRKLPVHNGCVNSICWNESGEYILSGSDDQHLVVTHGYNYKIMTDYKTSHRANIFSAKFLPCSGDSNVISCSGDGIILYTDLIRKEETFFNQFNCHSGTTYEVITVPSDPHSFLSCGEDGTVRWFDLRIKDKCSKPHCKEDILIACPRAVTALSINPMAPFQLAIGCSDSTVRLFDRRALSTQSSGGPDSGATARAMCAFTVPSFENRSYRITSLCFSPEGEEILVSYSSDHLYLFGVKNYGALELKARIYAELSQEEKRKKAPQRSPPPVRRLRLRGDWSDTGPDARPEREGGRRGEIAQARPTLHATLMQRMTDVLSRMLNDPATRAALSGGGEDSLDEAQASAAHAGENNVSSRNPDSNRTEDVQPCPVASTSNASSSTSSISVPQLSSLSIHSSDIANVNEASTAPQRNNEETASENVNALDLSHVAHLNNSVETGNPSVDNASAAAASSVSVETVHDIFSRTSSTVIPPSETRCNCVMRSVEECEQQSSSSSSRDTASSSAVPSGLELMKNNISNLKEKLSSLREGFIERHGSEPALHLMYSDKSSTKATISLAVADEVGRELHQDSNLPSSGLESSLAGGAAGQSRSADQTKTDTYESAAGPSQLPTTNLADSPDDAVFDGEDPYNDSDDDDDEEMILPRNRRFIHPIEKHMDEAIAAARHDKRVMYEETVPLPVIKQKFTGHRNARTMIKEATFWGKNFVLSGSDCGHVFVWNRYTAKLVMLLEADHHVVNCLQPHPVLPLLATSGIDYDVKLWAPLHEEPCFDSDLADVLTKRNEVMLEETKDTITVPASFMIRMLACLNQIRRGGRNRTRNARRQNTEDSSTDN